MLDVYHYIFCLKFILLDDTGSVFWLHPFVVCQFLAAFD